MRRGAWRGPALGLLVAALALSRCGEAGDRLPGGEAEQAAELTARVIDVVDGDTIEVELPDGSEEDVRYIGIDTPETAKPDSPAECGAPRASAVNGQLVGGREVSLRFGAERRDDYGRLLAYVFVAPPGPGRRPVFVNAELVRRGLARPLTIAPNDARAALFERLATRAAQAGRGLWGACTLSSTPSEAPPVPGG
ncbi:MAG: thermonuclease family protein [Solirubrobacterales bacterium]